MAKLTDGAKKRPHSEAKGLSLIGCAIIVLLSQLSFTHTQPDINWLGQAGYVLGWISAYAFGAAGYLVTCYIGYLGWQLLVKHTLENLWGKTFCFALFTISLSILLSQAAEHSPKLASLCANNIYTQGLRYPLGGVPAYYLYKDLPYGNLQKIFSDIGVLLIFSMTASVAFLLFTEIQILSFLRKIKETRLVKIPAVTEEKISFTPTTTPKPVYSGEPRSTKPTKPLPEKTEPTKTPTKEKRILSGSTNVYKLPDPSLLNAPKKTDHPTLKKELRRQADMLEETLSSFGIEAKVGEIHCGPTITSFEVHPAVGVKVQKIKTLENDIALNLEAASIRIIAPIPGKAAVGVEIPSLYPQEVSFKELLHHYHNHAKQLHIPVLLGKTIHGDYVTSDLAKMPHCIIAGATGSGKSVCINTLIISILMNARPDEIRLVMIDPKKVELTPYSKLPHLIAPVITEAHGAYAALNWLVKEMHMRYEILKQLGVRNISAFNSRTVNKELESSLSLPIPEKMYAIVAIIDEFADLMMASSSDLETPIARIAQMARAVGIHLVLATQRPSREVITGLIKANFPTRIAFKVASRVNSQIILDEPGAESLLGNGDLLFLPPGTSHIIRAQGAYISDEEINRVVSHICAQAPPHYLISSFDNMTREESGLYEDATETKDDLYNEAKSIVVDTQNASTTFLQRKLKIGYARAASLMDELEAHGIIAPQEGSKPRRVLWKNHEEKDPSP